MPVRDGMRKHRDHRRNEPGPENLEKPGRSEERCHVQNHDSEKEPLRLTPGNALHVEPDQAQNASVCVVVFVESEHFLFLLRGPEPLGPLG